MYHYVKLCNYANQLTMAKPKKSTNFFFFFFERLMNLISVKRKSNLLT